MSINELDAKVNELRELRNFEAEVKSEITAIEDAIKAEIRYLKEYVIMDNQKLCFKTTTVIGATETGNIKAGPADIGLEKSLSRNEPPKIFWRYFDLYRREKISLICYSQLTGISKSQLELYLASIVEKNSKPIEF